eukprot:m.54810 g.54810  ORF g.54810 m.54810 type:complete len:232 (-) comp12483_c0_seq2:1027-1722(-)
MRCVAGRRWIVALWIYALPVALGAGVGPVSPTVVYNVSSLLPVSKSTDPRALDTFTGFNHNMLHHQRWDLSLASLACDLNLQVLRYPGGTLSAFWDWRTGWVISEADFEAHCPNSTSYKYLQYARQYNGTALYDLANLKLYVETCRLRNGAEPTVNFVLNMITRNLTDQMAMLKQAEAIGVQVRLVELGNEFYAGVVAWGRFQRPRPPFGARSSNSKSSWTICSSPEPLQP